MHEKRFKHTMVFVMLPLSIILSATWLIHRSALTRWWCCDDTQILKHALLYSPLQYFFVPESWQALGTNNLTPWLTLAYDLDLAVFGFTPRGFYTHNLLSIGGCAVLIFLIIRRWVGTAWALGGAVLFLVGSPTVTASQQLMTRHYIEGLLFFLLMFWLFIYGLERGKRRYRILIGILIGVTFAMAVSAKEIYLPVGLIPFLIPIGTWRHRLALGWPILAVMVMYIPWRWYMIGNPVGGYTPYQTFAVKDVVAAMCDIAANCWSLCGRSRSALTACMALPILVVWRYGRRSLPFIPSIVAVPVSLFGPLFPLVKYPGLSLTRFYILTWAVFSLVFALLIGALSRGLTGKTKAVTVSVGIVLFAIMLNAAWKSARHESDNQDVLHTAHCVQGKALAELDDSYILYLSDDIAPWYVSGLFDLRPAMGITTPPPKIIYDESQISSALLENRRLMLYSRPTRTLTDITLNAHELLSRWRQKLRLTTLSALFEYDPSGKTLRWEAQGAGVHQVVAIVKTGGISFVNLRGIRHAPKNPLSLPFRLRFHTTDGGVAYTPLLALPSDPDENGVYRLTWSGWSEMFHPSDDRP